MVALVESKVEGARILTSAVNLGFGSGCNLAAKLARGEYLVLLNDDAAPDHGWLPALVETADAHPRAGAVGSRILGPDGVVLEAGSVLWRNGLISHVGRGLSASSPNYQYLRVVDYCSASSLLVRRKTWEELGGFDEGYFPGYYEDVDLCLSIARLGQVILYEPRSRVRHRESSSFEWGSPYKDFVAGRSRARFVSRWSDELSNHPSVPENPDALEWAVQRARKLHRRALVLDEQLSDASVGSCSCGLLGAIRQLAAGGYAVSVHATQGPSRPSERGTQGPIEELGRAGVEVVDGDLDAHLRRASTLYDVVLVGRHRQLDAVRGLVRRRQPQAAIVSYAEEQRQQPGTDEDRPEAVVEPSNSPVSWAEIADAARRERLARLRLERSEPPDAGYRRSG